MTCKFLFTSDNHCGHRAGLTPPEYQSGGREWVRKQATKWDWYVEVLKDIGEVSCHINVGDIIDGQGVKDASECIMEPNQQISAAVECVAQIETKEHYFVAGTRTHVTTRDGLELDWEVAKHVNGTEDPRFRGQYFIECKPYMFDIRHCPASRSFVPHTRSLPILRERMSNKEWALEGVQPLATHYFRGHVHYMMEVGEPNRWSGYLVPALQSADSKYGRTLSNVVHTGLGVLTIEEEGWPIWKVYEPPREKVQVFQFTAARK